MTGRIFKIRKYILFFPKICTFWKIAILLKIFREKVDFFLALLTLLMAAIQAAFSAPAKFHADEISFFLSISVRSKVIAFFCQNFAKVEHKYL